MVRLKYFMAGIFSINCAQKEFWLILVWVRQISSCIFLFATLIFMSGNCQSILCSCILCIACGMLCIVDVSQNLPELIWDYLVFFHLTIFINLKNLLLCTWACKPPEGFPTTHTHFIWNFVFIFIEVNLSVCSRSICLFTFYEWNLHYWNIRSCKFHGLHFGFFSSLISLNCLA